MEKKTLIALGLIFVSSIVLYFLTFCQDVNCLTGQVVANLNTQEQPFFWLLISLMILVLIGIPITHFWEKKKLQNL